MNPGTVREKLARLGEAAENGFALLNTAFAGEGVLIEADTGLIAPGPVEIMFVSSGQREDIAAAEKRRRRGHAAAAAAAGRVLAGGHLGEAS